MKALNLLVLCILAAVPGFGRQEQPPASSAQAEALEKAFKLIAEEKPKRAKEELDRAAALAGGPCGECLLGLSHVYAAQKKWDLAVDASQRAIPLLKTPGMQARAYNQLGLANAMLKTPDLAKAEEALRRGVALGGPWGAMARYNLAEVLFRQGDWAEAAQEARGFLKEARPPNGMVVKDAHVLLCRARTHLPDAPSPEPGADPAAQRVGGEVQPPELISQVKPVYTEKARQSGTTGTVIVEAIIDQEGCVRNVRALQELPHGLTESAMASIREWVFSPARLDGRPVKVYYVLTVNFGISFRP